MKNWICKITRHRFKICADCKRMEGLRNWLLHKYHYHILRRQTELITTGLLAFINNTNPTNQGPNQKRHTLSQYDIEAFKIQKQIIAEAKTVSDLFGKEK